MFDMYQQDTVEVALFTVYDAFYEVKTNVIEESHAFLYLFRSSF
jgi:hypothetical protein